MVSEGIEQVSVLGGKTSSRDGTLYFAYGSNLSPNQMRLRLHSDPASSRPVAVTRLDAYAWIICSRGYANIVHLPATTTTGHSSTVWGILYNLSAEAEARLDMFEGHDETRNPNAELNPDPATQQNIPYLQGGWDYNKHYLPMTVTKWLEDPNEFGIDVPGWTKNHQQPISIRGCVYVDEFRTQPGKINQEYIGRMNRGIREGLELGVPSEWVNAVLRESIPVGIEVDHDGYVGTDRGYVEAEATETSADVKERVLRQMQQSS